MLSINKFSQLTLASGILFLGSTAYCQTNLEYPGGPTSVISADEVARNQEYARNTLTSIDRLLTQIRSVLDGSEAKKTLVTRMEALAAESQDRASDQMLRHAIYTGLTINKLIEAEAIKRGIDNTPEGTVDQQVRILKTALIYAKDYYTSEFAITDNVLSKRDTSALNPARIEFGVRMTSFLIKMSDGVLDASSSYGMIRWSLGTLTNSILSDSRSNAFASTAKNLAEELKNYPDIVLGQAAPSDYDCIQYTKALKLLAIISIQEISTALKSLQPQKTK